MATRESAKINIGDMVACYIPYHACPSGYDLGVVVDKGTFQSEPHYAVDWSHGGKLIEPERLLQQCRNLYKELIKEHLYVESIQEKETGTAIKNR